MKRNGEGGMMNDEVPEFLTLCREVALPAMGFAFLEVTPIAAAELLKRNTKNRKLKSATAEALSVDVRNGAFLTTHQGIAFNERGELIDGQHRLEAVVLAKRPITVLVSWGWPVTGKFQVMDAVDRGTQRSLADQLSVQHGLDDAKRVVQLVNAIAATCMGSARVFKSTTANVLRVLELFPAEIKWALQFKPEQRGLRLAAVTATLALAYGVAKADTEDFYKRLLSGESLAGDNPILHVRNWLLHSGSEEDAVTVRNVVANHLVAHAKKQKCTKLLDADDAGMTRILKAHQERLLKVCAEYNRTPPEIFAAEAKPAKAALTDEILKETLERLGNRFSSTDVRARLEDGAKAGLMLGLWIKGGLIEPAGVNEYAKTAKGKALK